MSSILRKRVNDRFPKKWLMVLVLFVSAELPGTGNAETKQLPNGTPVTKFSVATTRSWKDDKGEWKDKTQWHTVVAYGQSFTQVALLNQFV